MRAAQREVQLIDDLDVQVSETGVWAIDMFRESMSTHHLAIIQDLIRSGLQNVERRIRELRRRVSRKRRRQAQCRGADAVTKRLIGEHNEWSRSRDRALLSHRNILRQIGDACAWLVLREDARIVSVLFDETKQHHLAEGIGLAGPIELTQGAHQSREFFVIENDLTRCLGTGDVTVVRTNGKWVRPLTLEIKSAGEFRIGAMLGLHLVTATSDVPVDEQLLYDFIRVLGLELRDDTPLPRNAVQQSRELVARSELMLAITTAATTALGRPTLTLWQSLQRVLDDSSKHGFAFDQVEPGVVYVGVDIRNVNDPKGLAERVQAELRAAGYAPDENPWHVISTEEVRVNEAASAYVAPIALWALRPETRVALLSGQLYFQCIYDPAIWSDALRRVGVAMEPDPDGRGWILRKDQQVARLDPIEVKRIEMGLAFSGLSPRELAQRISQGFEG